ncbi:ribbon-helix-helix domain-containing protein [Burkholderia pseudomultivorans]|uniref:CopG family transcriptional regulator n=1 Tax=Burkholderia pseudomultivorans TaxID=1207504 RepID=A0A132F692_9BURK|nr:ribbon-helix-helix protein, CopG family [Burkholderia pseudomultivorans]KWF70415.1 CopG family transcriptional regulator [Burkholderia pseudomultivorans]
MSATLERLTVIMPPEMAGAIRQADEDGEYASTSEVVREALRERKTRRQSMLGELAELKAEIDQGLADVAAGRLKKFDPENVIARGRQLLVERSK